MAKKKSKLKIIILSLIGILIVVLGGGFLYVNAKLNKVQKVEVNKDNLSINEKVVEENKDITNIALFGVDEPKGERGRSDSIMVLTIDKKHDKLKLTSIMRDSYVKIPGHGDDKITHAYAFGGPELAMKTLNENFNLNIKNFMTVNFSSLPKIIDEMGGVNINITKGDLKYINGYIDNLNNINHTNSKHITKTGKQLLNGTQALAYCRIRYDGGDQRRTERHRIVFEAMFDKLHNTPKSDYPRLIDEFLPYVQTNMSSLDMMGLAADAMPLANSKLELARFPLDTDSRGKTIKGVWYLVFDREETLDQIQSYIYDDKPLPKDAYSES